MSDTMLSALHIFPPKERHHNISRGTYVILNFHKETRLQEVEWQNQNLTLGPFGLLETHSFLEGKQCRLDIQRTHCKGCCLSLRSETFI